MPKRTWLACVCFGLFIAGCSQDQRELEKIGYIEMEAMDTAPGDRLRVTISVPLVSQYAKNGKTTDELLSTVSDSPKDAKKELSLRTSRILASGQIRTLMFGEDLARKGLWRYMDTFYRDPSISPRVTIVIVEGDAGEVISQEYPRHTKTANYLNKLLQKEFAKQSYPRTKLHQFFRDYYDDGQDPIATMIHEQEKDLSISGIALFRNDRMITKLPWSDVFFFSLMYQNLTQGEFTITSDNPDMRSIAFRAVRNKRKIKVTKNKEGLYEADIYLKVEGGVEEYLGGLKLSTADRRKVEKMISERIVTEADRIVKIMQKNRVDSIGLGQYVRNQMSYAEWKRTAWHDMFRTMPVRIHCSFAMKHFGNHFD
ncbi:Ger(x)C family spore germination protein [Paenibacillus macerans]|uniref:Ger(x)C family spore germination protein n=1 Tax=Paenibacillus macerans TaxID=44252 RepID=UPI003D323D61